MRCCCRAVVCSTLAFLSFSLLHSETSTITTQKPVLSCEAVCETPLRHISSHLDSCFLKAFVNLQTLINNVLPAPECQS